MAKKGINGVARPQPSEMEDWGAILVIVLLVGLWFLWPRYTTSSGRDLPPEPSCAYVTLPGDFPTYATARGSSDAKIGFARLPPLAKPTTPPPLDTSVLASQPDEYSAVPADAMILPPPPASPFATAPGNNVGISVDSALSAAGFAVDLSSVTSSAPCSLTATLSFNDDGCISALLVERSEGDPSALVPLRLSLLLSRTRGAATGNVTIWRR